MTIIHVARKPLGGLSVAGNVCQYGTGGFNIQACRIPLSDGEDLSSDGDGHTMDPNLNWGFKRMPRDGQLGRWPANLVLSLVAAFDLNRQTGNLVSSWRCTRNPNKTPIVPGPIQDHRGGTQDGGFTDQGGASRYFKLVLE